MNFVKTIKTKTNFAKGGFGGIKETVINMHRNDDKPIIDTSDVKKIVSSLFVAGQKKGLTPNIMVRALGATGWFSFPMSNDGTIDIKDFDEYFEGKVKNVKKFTKFSQLEIHVYAEK